MLSTREPQIGGGPAGGAGQVHEEPHKEFGSAEHTHTMSGLEIGIMVGIVLVFATLIGSLFWYRARKLKRMKGTQRDPEAGNSPGTKDGGTEGNEEVKRGAKVPNGSLRQLFGRKWFGTKSSEFSPDIVSGHLAVAHK